MLGVPGEAHAGFTGPDLVSPGTSVEEVALNALAKKDVWNDFAASLLKTSAHRQPELELAALAMDTYHLFQFFYLLVLLIFLMVFVLAKIL